MCLLWYNKFVKKFVNGRGHRKTVTQRYYEKLCKYRDKLSEYVVKLATCGENRTSYSKTDNSATELSA